MGEVWIVDDDEFYQNYLSIYLNSTGYKTRCFANGEECMRHLHENPWAILLDHNLGSSLDGTDILRMIKDYNKDIPVITISGSDRAEIAAEAFRSGSADYIKKDSASLIRLKLMLDRLNKLNEIRDRKKKNRLRVYLLSIVLIFLLVVLMIWVFLN